METEAQEVLETLARFGRLISSRDKAALEEFAAGRPTLLVGSEQGEIANGRDELAALLGKVFARPETVTWDWDRVDVSVAGQVAWLYAEGHVVVRNGDEEKRAPYRLTGIFEKREGRWRWRHFHGAEPA